MARLLPVMLLMVAVMPAHAGEHAHSTRSKYAGQDNRTIKSLSENDIAELRRGGGWGLAKSAELNGVPGPAHLLELKDRIPLSREQVAAVRAEFRKMNDAARIQGEELIRREAALEQLFRDGAVSEEALSKSLAAIGEARTRLRFIHLSAHLATPAILSAAQIKRYNTLRGYASSKSNACDAAPEGHDPEMWRKHNGCD